MTDAPVPHSATSPALASAAVPASSAVEAPHCGDCGARAKPDCNDPFCPVAHRRMWKVVG